MAPKHGNWNVLPSGDRFPVQEQRYGTVRTERVIAVAREILGLLERADLTEADRNTAMQVVNALHRGLDTK